MADDLAGLFTTIPDQVKEGEKPYWNMDNREIHERIRLLRQEVEEIRRLNEQYWQGNLPSAFANFEHGRRRKRLRQIRDELKSLGKLEPV